MLQLFQFVNVDDFGVLSFVGMARSVVDVEVFEDAAAKSVLGKHTFHDTKEEGVHTRFEVLVVRFLHKHFGGKFALTTGITCVVEIDFVGCFFAGKNDFVSVDDDYVVATFDKGAVARFVFAAKNFSDFRAETAKMLVGGVDDNPFALYLLDVR